jgi:hypothetical protein
MLFHITKEVWLSQILTTGLLVNTNNNGFVPKHAIRGYHEKYGCQPIFLTNDVDFVITTQLTEEYISTNKCVLLAIEETDLELEDEYDYLKQKYPNIQEKYMQYKTFICKQNIEPNKITFLKKLY